MAASSLLTLLDDIAILLDDVAVLSKVAVKKTAGVLGDDLALNAEQVSGIKAERELPVVWAVAKGSFKNKFIIVPTALLISVIYPSLITVLLVMGGLFLCYEGAEKVTEKFFHSKQETDKEHLEKLNNIADESVDLVALEKEKIKGAIRTDFILSAEIVVIVLGSVQSATFEMQVAVVSTLALFITVGVYGLVAAIVKLDDLGLYLLRKSMAGSFNSLQKTLGRGLLVFSPFLMKLLSVVGTIAMFLVGGGILTHSFSLLHHIVQSSVLFVNNIIPVLSTITSSVLSIILEGVFGLIAGVLVLFSVLLMKKLKQPNTLNIPT